MWRRRGEGANKATLHEERDLKGSKHDLGKGSNGEKREEL